jgi:hypothetical protein
MKKYLQAVAIWFLIIPIAILNGGLRENVLIKLGTAALPLSGIILSICIFVVAFLFIPKIKDCKKTDYIFIGIIWCCLTNLFDLSMFVMDGGGILDLVKQYYFWTGNLWIVVVLSTLSAPILAGIIRKDGR